MLALLSYVFAFLLGAACYWAKLGADRLREDSLLAAAMADIRRAHACLSAMPVKTASVSKALAYLAKWI